MEIGKAALKSEMKNLKNDLKKMHFLKIIHGDIKPENIMWSPSYQKNIFIDFGMSKVVKENIGQKSFTSFFGTYNFCSEDMKKLLIDNSSGYADLYFNDIFALKKVFEM